MMSVYAKNLDSVVEERILKFFLNCLQTFVDSINDINDDEKVAVHTYIYQ